jgi:addiction module toxin relE
MVMRIFKYRNFAKFADKQHIDDADLLDAVSRAERGLIDADLGGGVIKQRIARQGRGKSSGFRSIILFKHENRAFFVYAFAKNERDNISSKELAVYRDLAAQLLHLDDEILAELLAQHEYMELIK